MPLRAFEYDGTVLGWSKLITADDKYVYKYSFNKNKWSDYEEGVELLKEFDPDLFVDMYCTDTYLCYVTNKIDHIDRYSLRGVIHYKKIVQSHLTLYKHFGSFVAKKDMNPSNILHRKSDHKQYFIDWDGVSRFKNNDDCYKFYRDELCSHWWQQAYKLTKQGLQKTFDMEWEKLQ